MSNTTKILLAVLIITFILAIGLKAVNDEFTVVVTEPGKKMLVMNKPDARLKSTEKNGIHFISNINI